MGPRGAAVTRLEDMDLGTILVEDIDLSKDEPWQLVMSPYHGHMVPSWKVTQMARLRMKCDAPK
jgi:hypothetical protein